MAVNLTTDFQQFQLNGAKIDNPTSLQFGPDGKLYVSQQDGSIKIFTVKEDSSGYSVTATQLITAIKTTPNHDDDGSLNTAITSRQLTGIVVAGTADHPIIYATSSDPRYGKAHDTGLDTNSTTIHRLEQNASGTWEKVDIVRGLPRSEENHAGNGLQYDAATNSLYVAVGGNANMGAPSNNFGYLSEYAYSAAVLKVDLNAINKMSVKNDTSSGKNNPYIYDLPTLNDPTRADSSETVFGGNDGLNMAKLTAGSPVQIYSPGYRNPYDLVLTQSGKLYVVDNGSNQGWGGVPVIGPNGVTNQQAQNSSGQPDDTGKTTPDNLHLITGPGYYGGHANPIRANGAKAGLSDSNDNPNDGTDNGELLPTSKLPVDFNEVVYTTDPRQAYTHKPHGQNPALWTNPQSTNGLAEYTASNFNGEMKGDLLTVGFGGNLYWLQLNSAGNAVQTVSTRTIAGTPLDVTAVGDGKPFAGTIWVAQFAGDSIAILKPGTSSQPPSTDDDKDGLNNSIDRFALDADNGTSTVLNPGQTLLWSFSPADPDVPGPSGSLFGIGLTGVMTDGTTPYTSKYDIEDITPGGAAGIVTVDNVPAGTALGSANSAKNGFQFGVDASGTQNFTITAVLDNPFNTITNKNSQSQGIFIGTGEQNNYLAITAEANGGSGQIKVTTENGGTASSKTYAATPITGSSIQVNDTITLILEVNAQTGLVTPKWTYTTNNGATSTSGTGTAVQLSGATLQALKGDYTVNTLQSALAVGLFSTSAGGTPFTASWDSIEVKAAPVSGPDTSPPSATGVAADISAPKASHSILVVYADSGSGVKVSTIGVADISVSGPTPVSIGGVTTSTNADGSVNAVYTLNSPDGFTAADNGSYTVSLAGGAVTDNAGNAIAGKVLDGFTVNIGSSGGSNEINGTPGDDILNGTSADDIINGLAGKDKISGLVGNDVMKGGVGNDVYFLEAPGDQVVELAGEGTDEVNAYLSYTLPTNVEYLRLRSGAALDGTGNELNNRIIGNSATNKISGGAGNDNLIGSGAGDTLSGGPGSDSYGYEKTSDSTSSALDHILDFTVGEDKIDLGKIDANSAATGNQAFSFIGTSAFSGVAGQVRFDTGSPGVTGIFADVNGDKIADLHIQIDSSVTLNAASFVL